MQTGKLTFSLAAAITSSQGWLSADTHPLLTCQDNNRAIILYYEVVLTHAYLKTRY